jgi:hypothetical protein
MGAMRAALPAVVGPGPADELAADDGGAGQRQPELHYPSAPFGAPAPLAELVAQAWVRSITHRRLTWIG